MSKWDKICTNFTVPSKAETRDSRPHIASWYFLKREGAVAADDGPPPASHGSHSPLTDLILRGSPPERRRRRWRPAAGKPEQCFLCSFVFFFLFFLSSFYCRRFREGFPDDRLHGVLYRGELVRRDLRPEASCSFPEDAYIWFQGQEGRCHHGISPTVTRFIFFFFFAFSCYGIWMFSSLDATFFDGLI